MENPPKHPSHAAAPPSHWFWALVYATTLAGFALWATGVDAHIQHLLAAYHTDWFNSIWRVVGELGLGRWQILICLLGAWYFSARQHTARSAFREIPKLFFGALWLWLRLLILRTRPVQNNRHKLGRMALYCQHLPGQARHFLYGIPLMFGAGAVCFVLKILIGRARPKEMLWNDPTAYWAFGPSLDSTFWSFPSGHTTTTFALLVALERAFPQHRLWLWAAAILTSLARVLALTPHYMGDVLAGAALGYGVGVILANRYQLTVWSQQHHGS